MFTCSGCSNAGQLSNELAIELDRRGVAEMSCLAGVGAGKELFLKKLRDREVWVIDGCPIECSLGVFDQIPEHADIHIRLHDFQVKKNALPPKGPAFDSFVDRVLAWVRQQRATSMPNTELPTDAGKAEGPKP